MIGWGFESGEAAGIILLSEVLMGFKGQLLTFVYMGSGMASERRAIGSHVGTMLLWRAQLMLYGMSASYVCS